MTPRQNCQARSTDSVEFFARWDLLERRADLVATVELTEALRNNPARNDAILARIPSARWGQPEDFKGPTVFLASSAADYVSGEILVVDGGWMGR